MTDGQPVLGSSGGVAEPIGASRVLRDIRNQPGVESVEGRLVPLMSGAGIRAQLIDMPGGLYVHAHPHPTESLILTVSGRWVFSDGVDRKIVETGDLLHFPPNEPTGFEVPFDEPAVIYITKGDGGKDHDVLMADLRKAAANMAKEAEDGEVFSLGELPRDHPARVFARQLGFSGAD
jgi:quercetin dioxygenase-like cupin family protein